MYDIDSAFPAIRLIQEWRIRLGLHGLAACKSPGQMPNYASKRPIADTRPGGCHRPLPASDQASGGELSTPDAGLMWWRNKHPLPSYSGSVS